MILPRLTLEPAALHQRSLSSLIQKSPEVVNWHLENSLGWLDRAFTRTTLVVLRHYPAVV